MQEFLTIDVQITNTVRVDGKTGSAQMVHFTGSTQGPLFTGDILPGGVDTQTLQDGKLRLSARYILQGVDAGGAPCRIFIENNAEMPFQSQEVILHTNPTIRTDSPLLQKYEAIPLTGTIEPVTDSVIQIHIGV